MLLLISKVKPTTCLLYTYCSVVWSWRCRVNAGRYCAVCSIVIYSGDYFTYCANSAIRVLYILFDQALFFSKFYQYSSLFTGNNIMLYVIHRSPLLKSLITIIHNIILQAHRQGAIVPYVMSIKICTCDRGRRTYYYLWQCVRGWVWASLAHRCASASRS